uniref:hypothetical protein n=2 Tax=Pseudomonadota TaxID=1224 RepID=UPI001D0F8924
GFLQPKIPRFHRNHFHVLRRPFSERAVVVALSSIVLHEASLRPTDLPLAMTPADRRGPASRTRRFKPWTRLDALASFWSFRYEPIRYPHRDETEALRGDARRIGDDLRGVIAHGAVRESIKRD